MKDEMSRKLRIIIIDDDKNTRFLLNVYLDGLGHESFHFEDAESALKALSQNYFDIVFLDLNLGSSNGIELIPKMLLENPDLSIIVITGYARFESAVETIKLGAKNYLPKPFTLAQIRHVIGQLNEQRKLTQRVMDLENIIKESVPEANLETESPKMKTLLDTLARAARSDAAILLRGENGTGKGVLARSIHCQSYRSNRPFVVVNCPTLSDELLTSELFGHRKGSFTGAICDQAGRVESAEGGTLFLDEIGEISPSLQAKLLRFLQEKQFERIGENKTRKSDVRVIAATNRNLEADIESGHFREDLLYRINVIEVTVPPLRERPEDLMMLAESFLQFFARSAGNPTPKFSKKTKEALISYTWPGNIRELRNAIERAIIISPGDTIEVDSLPEKIANTPSISHRIGGKHSLQEIEKAHILKVMENCDTLEEAAAILGLDTSTLWRKRKKFEL